MGLHPQVKRSLWHKELPPAKWEQQTKPERGGKVGVIFYWDLELGNKAIILIPMPLAVENLVD